MDKREERGKSAIMCIAVAAIVIVSITVAMVSNIGAYSTGGLYNIFTNQTSVQSMQIGHDLDFSQGGGNVNEKGAGSATVFMTSANLTASLSTDSVDPGDDFTISGTATGSKSVEILIVSPKGYGGSNIEGGKYMYYSTTVVTASDNTFYKKISVDDDVDIGKYRLMVLSPGSDGLWGMYGYETLYNPDYPGDFNSALGQYVLWGRTQADMLEIVQDIIYSSDDLLWIALILVGEKEPLILNPVAEVVAGDTLEVTGESIWSDGSFIWLTVKGSCFEIEPQVAYVKDNTFNATFDTTGVPSGTYTVTATDGYRYIKSTLMNITADSYVPTLFDTSEGSYPGIMGTHEGTITIHKIGYETQLLGYESRMPLMLKAGTKAVSSSTNIISSDRDIGHYTVHEKTKEEYAGHLGFRSVKPELTMMKGTVQIKADATEVPELTVVQLKVTGISGHHIKVASDPISKNAYFPAGLDDNQRDRETQWFNDTIDDDGMMTYAVEFYDTGAYTVRVTDYNETGSYDTVDITVTDKDVIFDVPSTVVIGERFYVKGTSNTGQTVTIGVEDEIVQKLYQIVIDEYGKFEADIDTSSLDAPSSFMIPGSVRLKAYIDYEKPAYQSMPFEISTSEKADGSTEVFMVRGWLTGNLSEDTVEHDDEFTITGSAKGSKSVSIMIVAPKGFSGSNIETEEKWMYHASVGVSATDGAYSKTIRVGDDVDTGRYLVVMLSPDGDGLWGKYGYHVLYNPDDPEDPNTALGQYTLYNRTQEEMLAIFEDMVFLSDDHIWVGYITVAHEGTIIVQKMYTYSSPGTGGHSEYAAFYDRNGTKLGEGRWNGYQDVDYQYITFDAPFTLELGKTYNYSIKTGSYPQIIHKHSHTADNGTITCTEFTDANGNTYNDWIPAIRLE